MKNLTTEQLTLILNIVKLYIKTHKDNVAHNLTIVDGNFRQDLAIITAKSRDGLIHSVAARELANILHAFSFSLNAHLWDGEIKYYIN